MHMKKKVKQFLRRTERHTHTDMLYLVKNTSILSAAQLIQMFIGFALLFLFTNFVDPTVYGTYTYVLSFLPILSLTALPGIDIAFIQHVSVHPTSILSFIQKKKMEWSLLGMLGGLAIAVYYGISGNTTLMALFGVLAIFLPFYTSLPSYQRYFSGKKWFAKLAKTRTIISLSTLICIGIAILFTNSAIFLLIAFLLSSLVIDIYQHIQTKRLDAHQVEASLSEQKKVFGYGLKLTGTNILGVISEQIDKILIFQYVGATELAIYSVAMAPIEQSKVLFKHVSAIAFPKFASNSISTLKQTLFYKLILSFIFALVLLIIYVITAPTLFSWFFPAYIDSVPLSQILAISILAFPLIIISTVFEAQKKIHTIYAFRIIGSLVQIGLLWFFATIYGMIGIVIARVLSRFFYLFFSIILLRRLS